jgi:uncharacterized Zn finger protein (UPF0148 family)
MTERHEHTFARDKDGEVTCTICGDWDDEMDQVNSE